MFYCRFAALTEDIMDDTNDMEDKDEDGIFDRFKSLFEWEDASRNMHSAQIN